jgi:hypothetical protein
LTAGKIGTVNAQIGIVGFGKRGPIGAPVEAAHNGFALIIGFKNGV